MQLEIKFKKTHPDAQLPMRNHNNREITAFEQKQLDEENIRFQRERPEVYAAGYRAGFPREEGTQLILGTGDVGYDIFCVEDKIIKSNSSEVVDTGIDVAYISPGFWCRIEPRSGLGFKHGIQPHLGVIDNCYRGGLSVKLYNFSDKDYTITKGDRIAQLVFYHVIEPRLSWSEDKIDTSRGENQLGSSGK